MRKITKIKIEYYSKEILKYLLLAGLICVAATSPYFGLNVLKSIMRHRKIWRIKKQKAVFAFNYLKRKGLIEIQKNGHDVRITLTKEGRKRAGKYQINDLIIQKPKKWDGKWRVVIFDIPTASGMIRNIFRGKLKELGFYRLQQSIWICPYSCQAEVNLLREFLGLDKKHIQVLEVNRLEDSRFFKKHFAL